MTEGYEETGHEYETPTEGNDIYKSYDDHDYETQDQLPQYSDVIPSAPPDSEPYNIPPSQLQLQIDTNINNGEHEPPPYTEDIGCWKGYSESQHWKSLLLTILTIASIIWALCDMSEETFWIIIAVWIFYVLYIIECCCSSTGKYLSNIHDQETVALIMKTTHESPPAIKWRVQCYHYETRTYYDTYTDSDGKTHQQLRTETVRINTHSASMNFHFNSWEDVSEPWYSIHHHKLTKITCDKAYRFANSETQQYYSNELSSFKRRNDLDTYQDFSEKFTIKNMKTKLLAEMQPGVTPCCLNNDGFFCFSMCLMSFCYRVWFGSMVGRKNYVFVKEISI